MLVLTRKTQQQIQIGPDITITILQVKGKAVRVGIEAPHDVNVLRSEVARRKAEEAASTDEPTSTERPAVKGPSGRTSEPKRGGKQTPPTFSPRRHPTRCRAPRAERAPLIDYLKRSGPASFVVLADVVG